MITDTTAITIAFNTAIFICYYYAFNWTTSLSFFFQHILHIIY